MFEFTLPPSSPFGQALSKAGCQNAAHERDVLLGELAAKGGQRAATLPGQRVAMRGAALAAATASVAGVMLRSPPTAEADMLESISIKTMRARTPPDLGSAEFITEN